MGQIKLIRYDADEKLPLADIGDRAIIAGTIINLDSADISLTSIAFANPGLEKKTKVEVLLLIDGQSYYSTFEEFQNWIRSQKKLEELTT
jgi:hypothetical protein